MESIIALKPDVVFVSTASQIEAFMKTLEANGIAVYVTESDVGLTESLQDLRQLGDLFGTTERGRQSCRRSRKHEVSQVLRPYMVHDTNRRCRVFVQISKEPLFTIGKQSFLNEVVRKQAGSLGNRGCRNCLSKIKQRNGVGFESGCDHSVRK